MTGFGNEIIYTHMGEKFYQYGPGNHFGFNFASNIAIFFSDVLKNELRVQQTWSIDGTFFVCPKPWVQLYTVSIIINNHVVLVMVGVRLGLIYV